MHFPSAIRRVSADAVDQSFVNGMNWGMNIRIKYSKPMCTKSRSHRGNHCSQSCIFLTSYTSSPWTPLKLVTCEESAGQTSCASSRPALWAWRGPSELSSPPSSKTSTPSSAGRTGTAPPSSTSRWATADGEVATLLKGFCLYYIVRLDVLTYSPNLRQLSLPKSNWSCGSFLFLKVVYL